MESNRERWRKLSRQVIDTLLPLLSKLQVNLDSEVRKTFILLLKKTNKVENQSTVLQE